MGNEFPARTCSHNRAGSSHSPLRVYSRLLDCLVAVALRSKTDHRAFGGAQFSGGAQRHSICSLPCPDRSRTLPGRVHSHQSAFIPGHVQCSSRRSVIDDRWGRDLVATPPKDRPLAARSDGLLRCESRELPSQPELPKNYQAPPAHLFAQSHVHDPHVHGRLRGRRESGGRFFPIWLSRNGDSDMLEATSLSSERV